MTTPPPDGLRPSSACSWCRLIPDNGLPNACVVACSCWDYVTDGTVTEGGGADVYLIGDPPTPKPCDSPRCPAVYREPRLDDPFAVRFMEVL